MEIIWYMICIKNLSMSFAPIMIKSYNLKEKQCVILNLHCYMISNLKLISLQIAWEENVLNIQEVLTGLIMPSVVAQ